MRLCNEAKKSQAKALLAAGTLLANFQQRYQP
jgi:hypothetical protein